MRRAWPSRTLAAMIALGVANHMILSGGRVVVTLDAIHMGGSPALVGLLMALFALLPMFLSVLAGRLVDRIGARRPMLWGSIGCVAAAALPAVWPALPALFIAASLAGLSFMMFQVPLQRVTGELSHGPARATNFSWLALGFSLSGFAGPLVAGFAIEGLGYRGAFALLAASPIGAVLALAKGRVALPEVKRREAPATPVATFDLLRNRDLRRVLALNALFALGWDLHTVFVPLYGSQIGLSAIQIGAILSAFAAATIAVRLGLPLLATGTNEQKLLRASLVAAAGVYLAFPFVVDALALAVLSFVLGLGLGMGQPLLMSLLHDHAPEGRVGETVGMRMSMIQTMAVAVPLVFGTLGGTVGLLPMFWTVGLFLGGGGLYARRPP